MFRTVLIKKSSKLQLIQGYLVIYDGDVEKKVFLNDISLLLIESTGTLITVPLMIALVKKNIAVIFCDEKHNPAGLFLGLNNHYHNSGNLFRQIEWKKEIKEQVWSKIVKEKIRIQKMVLNIYGSNIKDQMFDDYIEGVQGFDSTNREGIAAKVYFNEMFGLNFNRTEENSLNSYLDYGYSILLSCFNREIVSSGYLTQLGIFHIGKTNPFNLASDFMEPFRPIADILVKASSKDENPLVRIRKLLTFKIIINKEERYLDDAIRVYTSQLIRCLNEEDTIFPAIELKSLSHYSDVQSDENDSNV